MGFELSTTPDTRQIEQAGRNVNIPDEAGRPYQIEVTPATDDAPAVTRPAKGLIAGTYSKRFKAARKRADEKERELGDAITDEERETIQREMWGEAVISWDLTLNGSPDPFAIFEKKPHIYDFVVATSTNHAGFFTERLAA